MKIVISIKRYPNFFILFSLFLTSFAYLSANTDVRDWELRDGTKLTAELVYYDSATEQVLLRFHDVQDRIVSFSAFSSVDQAWLVEWQEVTEILASQIDDMGGEFIHKLTVGNQPTDLFIYWPASMECQPPPLLILFHPGGKGARYAMRHIEAAEKAGIVLVACGQFRNTGDDFESEKAFLERFREVFPQILDFVAPDPSKVFIGGTSGGAGRAFHYTAWIDYPWAGVYSNGGWTGGNKYRFLPYPSNMRIIMVNGNQDRANREVDADTQILQAAGNKVGLILFEGGHQVPPPASQLKAFHWLLESEDFDEH